MADVYPSPLAMLFKWERTAPKRVYLRQPVGRVFHETTWAETADQARRICRQRGWKMVDVGGRAVEENATRIVDLYQQDPPGA